MKQLGLDVESQPEIYLPHAQVPVGSMDVVLRTDAPAPSLAPAVRRTIQSLDADLPVAKIQTVEDVVANSIAQPRFYALLLRFFASMALLLAAVGIFGVMSYSVAQRTREIGIRIALGAEARFVRRLVLGQAMALAVVGLAIGTIAALALSSTMQRLLFSIGTRDPATYTTVAVVLAAVALLASYLPARRARSERQRNSTLTSG